MSLMNMLRFFRDGKLKVVWEYHVNGIIWRLLFSGNDRIVGEDRDQHSKRVSFFCLDARSGKPLWEDLRMDEQWWITIELIGEGVLFLNEFVRPDLPEQGKIYAVDLETGSLLWKNSELKILFVAGAQVYAVRELFDRRIYYALDVRSGERVSEFEDGAEQINLLREEWKSTVEEGMLFPEILTEQSRHFNLVHSIVTSRYGADGMKGPVDFIHFGKYVLIGFHRFLPTPSRAIDTQPNTREGMMENRFLIVEADSRKIVLEETLNKKVPNPAPNSFFVQGDLAYYIRDKQHLVAIQLKT